MNHTHNHSCTCEHKQVKFCKVCRVVHCLSCNQEWTLKGTFSYNYPWYTTTAQPGLVSGGCGGNQLTSIPNGVYNSLTRTETACAHQG